MELDATSYGSQEQARIGSGYLALNRVSRLDAPKRVPDRRICGTGTDKRSEAAIARILLIGGDEASAALIRVNIERRPDNSAASGYIVYWEPRFEEAPMRIRQLSIDALLFDLSADAPELDQLDFVRGMCHGVPMVILSENALPESARHRPDHGVDEQICRRNLSPASIQRAIAHALERHKFTARIASSLRRERLRSQMLVKIASAAPLATLVSDLSDALQRELSGEQCGLALRIGEFTTIWPDDDSTATRWAASALGGLHSSNLPNWRTGDHYVCTRPIKSGGRLLGRLAVVAGPGGFERETVGSYARLGAELLGLAVDRQHAADRLQQSQDELRQLSQQLLNIQECERQRIAADLHDVIGQSLSVVKVSIEEAQECMEKDGASEAAATLRQLVPWIKTALGEVRRISMDLRPATIDDLGILPTLSWFLREFSASRRNIYVEQRITALEAEIPEGIKIVIFRVLQEAVCNVVKHAQASRIQVVLQRVGSSIEFAIIDNGVGFDATDPESLAGKKSRLGLCSMRERVRLSGGHYTLESTKGVGTSVLVNWPLAAQSGP